MIIDAHVHTGGYNGYSTDDVLRLADRAGFDMVFGTDIIALTYDMAEGNRQLAVDMKSCTAIICNDSGLMHSSLALGLPVIAIFGSTVRELGFYPYKGVNFVLENNSLSCRPCSHIGRKECPKGHLKCLYEIQPVEVFNTLQKFLRDI